MHDEPELLVPLSEAHRAPSPRPRSNWRLAVARAWCVLGVIMAFAMLINGDGPVHWRWAVYTLAGFYFVWQVVAWICRPALPPQDDQR